VKNSLLTSLAGITSAGLFNDKTVVGAENSKSPGAKQVPGAPHRLYDHLLVPREHPDYTRRHVQPPGWDTFDGHTHLITLRDFEIENGLIVRYQERIDKYVVRHELGDVLWISYPILEARNLGDLADEIKRRNLFLFDIWGYVPGSGPAGFGRQFRIPSGSVELLESKLGTHWLGVDNGEQDGRYIGGYASELYPSSAGRREQYLNFQHHFERLTGELGNKLSTLVSLNFGHYFLKEGVYTFIGAETAQALPNGQVFYAFIRGAGKQYGVPWFGNASVFNRWGWKQYTPDVHDRQLSGGPTHGTSLSLLKRLLYSQILYNSMMVGFESSYFHSVQGPPVAGWGVESDELSPIGLIQRAAGKWLQASGQPGVMMTPVALLLDFFAGWTFPRHLYTSDVYRVWGNLPYEPGDYLTDGVLDMIYPGYQDSSYFHDESGFIAPTPYGDIADCLLSDAPAWLLARYPLLVIAGELGGGAEIRDKLETYVEQGGRLILTAGNLAKLPGGLAGIQAGINLQQFDKGTTVRVGTHPVMEDRPFELHTLVLPKTARPLAECSGVPAVVVTPFGKGDITVLASPFGVSAKEAEGVGAALAGQLQNEVDKPLPKPYPLLKHARAILDQAFRAQMLFEAGEGLSLITCRKGSGEYTLGVTNNSWRARPFKIVSRCGPIESIHELTLDQSEKGAVGHLPEGLEKSDLGVSDGKNIAGGDVRIFAVRVKEENIEVIAHAVPAVRPQGRALPLRRAISLKEEVLLRPTFFEHFDSVVMDWRYLQEREPDQLKRESAWIRLQGLACLVDFTSGINLYPDLRLVDNIELDYAASLAAIEGVMAKMGALEARELILSLNRRPENGFTRDQTWQSFAQTLRRICERARAQQATVHLRLSVGAPSEDLRRVVELAGRVDALNFRLAPSTALLLSRKNDMAEFPEQIKDKVGLWLLSFPRTDLAGRVWDANAPIRECNDRRALAQILALAPEAPLVFDAVYKNLDEEYLDAKFLRETLTSLRPADR
jgi:hypothetical protein